MSKLLDETGVSWIFNKIKSVFLTTEDAEEVSLVNVDSVPTSSSINLVESGGVYSEIYPSIISSQPLGGMLPNRVYDLGELTGTITFTLASPSDNTISNPYHWTFDTGSTAPTIVWPSGIIWPDGFSPSIDINKHYEVLVRNNYASILTYSIPSI